MQPVDTDCSHDCEKMRDVIKQIADRSFEFECYKFLISLNQDYYNDPEFQVLLDYVDSTGTNMDAKMIKIASRYLDFFEPFYYLIKNNYLKIEQVDEMFAYRFFAIVNNADIQEKLIDPHYSYYGNICRLHNLWSEHRNSKEITETSQSGTDLKRFDWYEKMCRT